MEQASEPSNINQAGNEAIRNSLSTDGVQSKRLKELANAALQTTLIARMEAERTEHTADPDESGMDHESREGEHSNGLSFNHVSGQNPDRMEEETSDSNTAKERDEEERTLTDHLNKRLLSSFLEKLNGRDLALPGVQHIDCAVADEDSNRASEEW